MNELSNPTIGSRINVVGTTGSGKTTAAKLLAERLDLRCIELDALFWKPGWEQTPDDEFLLAVDHATLGDKWVLDGNYSRSRSITWPRADTIIWLDYRFPRVFCQLLGRSLRRSITHEELWSGCHERLYLQFFSSESILLWCLKTYVRRRRNYPRLFERPEHAHLHVLRFRSPRQFQKWFDSLPAKQMLGCLL